MTQKKKKKSDRGFQGLSLLMELQQQWKNHSQYLILQRGSSSCKEVVNKDLETLTNKVENQKQRFLWKLSENWKPAQWKKEPDPFLVEPALGTMPAAQRVGFRVLLPGGWKAGVSRKDHPLWSSWLISDTLMKEGHGFLVKHAKSILSVWNFCNSGEEETLTL